MIAYVVYHYTALVYHAISFTASCSRKTQDFLHNFLVWMPPKIPGIKKKHCPHPNRASGLQQRYYIFDQIVQKRHHNI